MHVKIALHTLAVTILVFATLQVQAQQVRLRTPLGDIEIELLAESAPLTVANFLSYINDGDYVDTFMHRSVPGFIIQGGGFTYTDEQFQEIPADLPVQNEFGVSKTRGTLAMAKLGGDPNSATNQWFINLADNSANLDNQNGGFTVFARVVGDGMVVADALAALTVWNGGGVFSEIPLIDYPGQVDVTAEHIVFVELTPDTDDDGVYDDEDAFPDNPEESLDTDLDQIGNNEDEDDDGDGMPDEFELLHELNPLNSADAELDLDADGFSNLQEFIDGTDPGDPRSNDRARMIPILMNILGGSNEEE